MPLSRLTRWFSKRSGRPKIDEETEAELLALQQVLEDTREERVSALAMQTTVALSEWAENVDLRPDTIAVAQTFMALPLVSQLGNIAIAGRARCVPSEDPKSAYRLQHFIVEITPDGRIADEIFISAACLRALDPIAEQSVSRSYTLIAGADLFQRMARAAPG